MDDLKSISLELRLVRAEMAIACLCEWLEETHLHVSDDLSELSKIIMDHNDEATVDRLKTALKEQPNGTA